MGGKGYLFCEHGLIDMTPIVIKAMGLEKLPT